MGDCLHMLNSVKRTDPDNVLLGVNCELAKERAVQDCEQANASPLMLDAVLLPHGEREPILRFSALNTRRETDRLLLAGKTATGELLRVVYSLNGAWKEASLVTLRGVSVRKVSTEDIQRLGSVKRSEVGIEVNIRIKPGTSEIPIPDITPIVAAVGDRNGYVSNFIKVRRQKAARYPNQRPSPPSNAGPRN